MAILAECPICRKKQAIKNKACKCGAELHRLKRSKRVKYLINYRLPDGQQKREYVGSFEGLDGYSTRGAVNRLQEYLSNVDQTVDQAAKDAM